MDKQMQKAVESLTVVTHASGAVRAAERAFAAASGPLFHVCKGEADDELRAQVHEVERLLRKIEQGLKAKETAAEQAVVDAAAALSAKK
jgi:hypothetical protein